MQSYRKKLIEVALPLKAINVASAREKSIRHGHPSTLHLWWARRPLAACRAVLFSSLVDDPDSDPAYRKPDGTVDVERAGLKRAQLFNLIEELVLWENSNNPRVINQARAEIARCVASRKIELGELKKDTIVFDTSPKRERVGGAGVPPAKSGNRAGGTPAPQFEFTDPRTTPFVEPKSRGNLPHLYKEGGSYFVTFRLWDAVVPKEERKDCGAGVPPASSRKPAAGTAAPQKKQKTREEIAAESEPPLRLGSCMLANPTVAEMAQNAVKHFHGERYYLHAWCVMGNHLHVVYTAMGEHTPKDIHHTWKSYTAHQANKILKRTGTFWESEGFDHLIRSVEDLEWFIEYTENNPVAAGLCECKEDWPWSSAGTGWNPGAACGAGVPPAASQNKTASLTPAESQKKKAGGTPAPQLTVWQGAAGLAEDVRYYGQWMRDEAEKRIGHLYPKVKITATMAHDRPDLKQYVGQELTVIAWLWARTVASPNPAFQGVNVPLVRSFWLSKKSGKQAWVEPVIDRPHRSYRFLVRVGTPTAVHKKAVVEAGTSRIQSSPVK